MSKTPKAQESKESVSLTSPVVISLVLLLFEIKCLGICEGVHIYNDYGRKVHKYKQNTDELIIKSCILCIFNTYIKNLYKFIVVNNT